MQPLSIAIAGCGISGLASALLLSRAGHRVCLYERFAAPQPVGSGLMIQPTGMAVLAELGLAESMTAKGAPVTGLLGLNREGEPVLEAAYSDLPRASVFGLGIHRADLFGILYEAVLAERIPIETGFAVSQFAEEAGGAVLIDEQGRRSASRDLVVDALGLRSPLVPPVNALLPFGALWANVELPKGAPFCGDLLEQRYERALRMVGVLPVGVGRAAFFWSLTADEYAAWQAGGMARWWDEVEQLWPQCCAFRQQLREADQLVFARYAHRTSRQSPSERLVHLGDAWHAASPQLGQGANMALLDAYALVLALKAQDLAASKARFLALRQWHVRLYQALTWAFTPPFQSAAAWPAILRDLLLAPASRVGPGPRMKAHLVAGLAGDPLTRLGLAMPDYLVLAASSTASRASAVDQS
ncbi:FAD-dependent oxidoreductase [Aurantiacibacter flavus]|uniref:NAD(P)/FAD-dependent oxidoreductase n=1 Tax=Aurantiacibacter flavus TaxID=3145232 RepID=A0ABV0CSA2_9SPHN